MRGRDSGLTFAMTVFEAASSKCSGVRSATTRCAILLRVNDQYGCSLANVLTCSAGRASTRLVFLSVT
jgi:hypothetical protein